MVAQLTVNCEPLCMTKIPKDVWDTLAMDLQGPYPTGDYLLALIDYRSRYPVVGQMRETSSKNVIKTLNKTFTAFGYPKNIVTDNGPQFVSEEMTECFKKKNINHRRTTPYWPQANGEIERFNKTLLKHNKAAVVDNKDWRVVLDDFLLDYRTSSHSTTGIAPATMMFGRKISNRLPEFSKMESSTKDNENINKQDFQRKQKMKENAERVRSTKDIIISNNDIVLVRNMKKSNKLSTIWENKLYKVIKVFNRSVKIQDLNNGKFYIRSKSHIKKYHGKASKNKVRDMYEDEEFLEIDFKIEESEGEDTDDFEPELEVNDIEDRESERDDVEDVEVDIESTSRYGRTRRRPDRLIETIALQ